MGMLSIVLPAGVTTTVRGSSLPVAAFHRVVDDGAALIETAAVLESEGKLEEAGSAYDRAATAFAAAGPLDRYTAALRKSARVLKRYAPRLRWGHTTVIMVHSLTAKELELCQPISQCPKSRA